MAFARGAGRPFDLAVVTGASSGIGAALARRLCESGAAANVVGVGRRAHGAGDWADARFAYVSADVATEEGRAAVGAAVAELLTGRSARVAVVHNAADAGELRGVKDLNLAKFRETMATNVEAPLFLTQTLLPHLGRGSRVLHVSSGAAHGGISSMAPYCASKAALLSLKQALAMELAPEGILVGSAQPGVVDTAMQRSVVDAARGDYAMRPYFEGLRAETPAARAAWPRPPPQLGLDTAENVACFFTWLLRDADDGEFGEGDWDIQDAKHHDRWAAAPDL
ncbi:hypothetical protein M885DRAFT_554691 [Pelagophyceae sp. CCMP2097]|nr:hypothetical protein M885DRAFT_554691 [Pelagophyceae sp. CCMP2097]